MLNGLDWKTTSRNIDYFFHWRVVVCIISAGILSTMIWHEYFPHVMWFTKLWAGLTTGLTAGMLPGTIWQLYDDKRRSRTSGKFILLGSLAWGLLAGISLFIIKPDLYAQEQERSWVRALSTLDISSIAIDINGQSVTRIKDAEKIASFVRYSNQAELFYPSHEIFLNGFKLTITLSEGKSVQYDGGIPERHLNDLVLSFRGRFTWSYIIIPNARVWLEDFVDSSK